jgi:hypothetical protein
MIVSAYPTLQLRLPPFHLRTRRTEQESLLILITVCLFEADVFVAIVSTADFLSYRNVYISPQTIMPHILLT